MNHGSKERTIHRSDKIRKEGTSTPWNDDVIVEI